MPILNSSVVFSIGGTNIVPFAAVGGVSRKRNNVEGGNNMKMQSGAQFADRIAAGDEWTFNFRPLTAAEQATLLGLIDPSGVTVQHTDPETNTVISGFYYPSDIPATYLVKRADGTEWWGGLSVTFSSRNPVRR